MKRTANSLESDGFNPERCIVGSYVAVVYEQSWWIGVVIDVNDEEKDVEVKFMHPKGPAPYFNWPE